MFVCIDARCDSHRYRQPSHKFTIKCTVYYLHQILRAYCALTVSSIGHYQSPSPRTNIHHRVLRTALRTRTVPHTIDRPKPPGRATPGGDPRAHPRAAASTGRGLPGGVPIRKLHLTGVRAAKLAAAQQASPTTQEQHRSEPNGQHPRVIIQWGFPRSEYNIHIPTVST